MRKVLLTVVGLYLLTLTLLAQDAPPSADTFVNSSSPGTNYGSSVIDVVGPGASTFLKFNLAGVPAGTLISNQGLVDTAELPDLLTDGDNNPATGPEPTVVVVGNAQQLTITKLVTVVGGGPARAGFPLEFIGRRVGLLAPLKVGHSIAEERALIIRQHDEAPG